MSLLSRLLGNRSDPRDEVRILWHRIVEIAREKDWYARYRVADTVAGRFDMITAVLAIVLIRMEREPELVEPSVRLAELFVDDMDAQLREAGIGDVVVGKHIGKLMEALGGRLGAYRTALADGDMLGAVSRNVSFAESSDPEGLASALVAFDADLRTVEGQALLAGQFRR